MSHAAYELRQARIITPSSSSRAALPIVDGRIAAATPPRAIRLDLPDHLVLPGLINAHDHLHLNAIPALPADRLFANSYDWISAFQAWFQETHVAAAIARPSAQRHWHGGLKNLLAGTTTVAHHDPYQAVFDDPAFPVHVPSIAWSHSPGLSGATLPPTHLAHHLSYGPPVPASYRATPVDQPWIIHLAEGSDALAMSEFPWLESQGCLGPNTLLVHAVGVLPAQRTRLIAAGAAVIWCPASNLRMLGRTLDPLPYLHAGRLTIGSDSRLSGAPDLLAELRLAAAQTDLPPARLVQLATHAAARLLRLAGVGALLPGYRADLLILRDPGGDPAAALLAAERADLRAVLRAGKPAICDPDLGWWMQACGGDPQPIQLDGRAKLIDRCVLGAHGAAELEPGLSV